MIAEDGSRAVGTRMSEAVYDEVIRRGGTWSKPAFVVNDWYITAYEPIRDPSRTGHRRHLRRAASNAVRSGANDRHTVRFLLLMTRGHGGQSGR